MIKIRMKKMKNMTSLVLTLAMMIGMCVTTPVSVQASEETDTLEYVDGSYLTEEEESTVMVYPRMRGTYLLQGAGTISKIGSQMVGCSGSTTANFAVSKVSVTISLQRYVNQSWVSIAGWTTADYNTNYVSSYKGYSVTGGYYYRVQTQHWASTDWTMGATDGIWIPS